MSSVLRVGVVIDGALADEQLLPLNRDVTIGSDPACDLIVPDFGPTWTLFQSQSESLILRLDTGMRSRLASGDDVIDVPPVPPGALREVDLTLGLRGRVAMGRASVLFQQVPSRRPSYPLPMAARRRSPGLFEAHFAAILVLCAALMGGGGVGADVWWRVTGQYLEQTMHSRNTMYETLRAEVVVAAVQPTPAVPQQQVEEVIEPVEPAPADPQPQVAEVKKRPQRKRTRTGQRRKTHTRKQTASAEERARRKTFLHVLGSESKNGPGGFAGLLSKANDRRIAKAFEELDKTTGVAMADDDLPRGPELKPDLTDPQVRYRTPIPGDMPRRVGKAKRITIIKKAPEKKVRAKLGTKIYVPPAAPGDIAAAVRRMIRRRRPAIRLCYERVLQRDEGVGGNIRVSFVVGTAGRITKVSIKSNSTGSSTLAGCVKKKMLNWRVRVQPKRPSTFATTFVMQKL